MLHLLRSFNIKNVQEFRAAVELQPRNNPLNEDAALLKRYAVSGGPDGPKLRIGEGDHVTMVLPTR
jgi:hypothetical protein